MEGESAFMEQIAPLYTELDEANLLRAINSIGIKTSDLLEGARPCVVNTGNAFLVIALQNQNDVKSVNPVKEEISAVSKAYDLIGYDIFSPQAMKKGRDVGARMFAPRYGIDEESATGMAAGPLACYLHDKLKIKKRQFMIEQGYLMPQPSPSVIYVRLKKNSGPISSLMAGGVAAVSEVKHVEI